VLGDCRPEEGVANMTQEVEVKLAEVSEQNNGPKPNGGKLLRDLRRSHNWTQAQLGEKMGLTPQAVSLIEKGKNAFSPKHLTLLCKARIDSSELNDLAAVAADYRERSKSTTKTTTAKPPLSVVQVEKEKAPETSGQEVPSVELNSPGPPEDEEGWEDINEACSIFKKVIEEVRASDNDDWWKDGFEAHALRKMLSGLLRLYKDVPFDPADRKRALLLFDKYAKADYVRCQMDGWWRFTSATLDHTKKMKALEFATGFDRLPPDKKQADDFE
jgi:transcriptional regulator with XRE-family HTH domain